MTTSQMRHLYSEAVNTLLKVAQMKSIHSELLCSVYEKYYTNYLYPKIYAVKENKYQKCSEKSILSVGELNPGLPRDRRGYLPLY